MAKHFLRRSFYKERTGHPAWNRRFALAITAVSIVVLVVGQTVNVRAEVPDGLRGAIQRGDAAETRRFLAQAPTDQQAAVNTAALRWSAYYGWTEMMDALLKHGTPATAGDARGWTALMAAVKGNSPAAVDMLLDHGADPDAPLKNSGHSAATLAAELGHADLLARLRRHRPVSPSASAALVSAGLDIGRLDLVEAALADPAFRLSGVTGQDALLLALIMEDLDAVPMLLDRGANGSDPGSSSDAPPPLIAATMTGDVGFVRRLLDRGADVNRVYEHGVTPLGSAVVMRAEKAADELLAHGAKPDPRQNLVVMAVERGVPSLIPSLLAAGADINQTDDLGCTALMVAVTSHHESVDALLAGHPRLDLRDHAARSVFDLPDGAWFAEKLRTTEKGTPPDAIPATPHLEPAQLAAALVAAVERNDLPAVRTLLDQGAKPDTCDKLGWSVSILAACKGYTEVLRCLYERDPFVLTQVGPDRFWDVFLEAAANGHVDTVQFLLAHPHDSDTGPEMINTALDYAGRRSHHEMENLLREELKKNPLPPDPGGIKITHSTRP